MDLGDEIQVLNLLPIASVTSSGNGTGIDLQDYEGEFAFVVDVSNTAGTTPTMDIKLQDSDDNSTFADISGAAFAQFTTGAAFLKLSLNVDEHKRYFRAVKTIGGTSSPAYLISGKAMGIKKYPA